MNYHNGVRDNKEKFMDKRVVVYCTGGVRCEKFSGWMVREGYKDVGQLHGGIATYGKTQKFKANYGMENVRYSMSVSL